MVVSQFGNWTVGTQGIAWCGGRNITCVIPLDHIVNTGSSKNAIIYEWLVEVARDSKFTDEEIYCLNTAFIYALDFMLGVEFEVPQYALLAETFKEQQDVLKARKKNTNNNKINGAPAKERSAS
jgi:hypothetical protein